VRQLHPVGVLLRVAGVSSRQLAIILAMRTVQNLSCALVIQVTRTGDHLDVRVPGSLSGRSCKMLLMPAFGAVTLPLCERRYRLPGALDRGEYLFHGGGVPTPTRSNRRSKDEMSAG
jgi:hypothetical protein